MSNEKNGQKLHLYKIRHSLAHVMAQAVLEIFPEGKIAIGPPIDDGFYYDFDLPRPLTPEDLVDIEARMRVILQGDDGFARREVSADEARHLFAAQPYKLELIDGLAVGGFDENGEPLPVDEAPIISTYRHNGFEDLCKGPHVERLGQIDPCAFKLLNIAGAYWRGDENRQQLQRIYGTAWESPAQLAAYLDRLEEARKRDHRKLGKDLELFSLEPDYLGSGLVLWHPKGALVRHLIELFWRDEHLAQGYDLVSTPHIGRSVLWQTSGHLEFFKEDMYSPIEVDGQQYYLKPMNCPFHILIYRSRNHSYREFPLRLAEWGTVYRHERSGALHGILRPRGFTQDDAHHFCRQDQMPDEIDFVLNFCLRLMRSFGLNDFTAFLSTRPEGKATGDKRLWDEAEAALEASLKRSNLAYEVDEGGGAFYGPKIDLNFRDAIGRNWQLSTIQFDFNLPERFDLNYVGPDGQLHRPYMVHRTLLGSLERFLGVLIEHYAGAFPVWLSPVQAMVIPIADRHVAYAEKLAQHFKAAGLRVEVDGSAERMGNKIRKAQEQKVPYMLVIGDQEIAGETVSLRRRDGQNLGAMPIEKFIVMAQSEIANRE